MKVKNLVPWLPEIIAGTIIFIGAIVIERVSGEGPQRGSEVFIASMTYFILCLFSKKLRKDLIENLKSTKSLILTLIAFLLALFYSVYLVGLTWQIVQNTN